MDRIISCIGDTWALVLSEAMVGSEKRLRDEFDLSKATKNARVSEWILKHEGGRNDPLGNRAAEPIQSYGSDLTGHMKELKLSSHQSQKYDMKSMPLSVPSGPHSTLNVEGKRKTNPLWDPERQKVRPESRNSEPCPAEGCLLKFDTVKRLNSHIEDCHEYCKIHKIFLPDFDAYHEHKVESPDHLTCPICSEDFMSIGGRDRHMMIRHPKSQACECPGCLNTYSRASSLMNHIESNLCDNITWAQFMKIHMKKSLLAGKEENKDDELDTQDDRTISGTAGAANVPIAGIVSTYQDSDKDTAVVARKDDGGSLSSHTKPSTNIERADDDLLNFEPVSIWTEPQEVASAYGDAGKDYLLDDGIDEDISFQPLMPLADLPADKTARMKRLGRMMWGENALKRINDILNPKHIPDHLNPFSERFNSETFNSLGRYRCPYCRQSFEKSSDLTRHMQSPVHHRWDARCPQCFSLFRGAAALVSHMESPSFRCKIKESEYFQDALEVATSGFVAHERQGGEHVFKGCEPELD